MGKDENHTRVENKDFELILEQGDQNCNNEANETKEISPAAQRIAEARTKRNNAKKWKSDIIE